MKRERIIFDNRSSKPLYDCYEQAFEVYFQHWDSEINSIAAATSDLKFFIKTNKESVTIQIYDNETPHQDN